MAGFDMCDACRAEYDDPTDRRFHAQPVCCPACGPRLSLLDADGSALDEPDPIAATARLLASGSVVAVKGLGGYHLAAAAGDDAAVATLRSRKHREERPFALMVRDLDMARRLCKVSADDERLLTGPAAPIVLLPRHDGGPGAHVAPAVAPGHPSLGVMLPYTPLHHLLMAAYDGPIVLTSGNLSDEPIAYDDEDALRRLDRVADAFLVHNRPIRTRVDDSVVRALPSGALPVRRSRGYAPRAVRLPQRLHRHVLACGAELKSTFCLARDDRAFVSHHIGDLENYETLQSFTEGIAHMQRLFDVTPELVAHDLHPQYLSTEYAVELDGVELLGVQHHHAHIASCLVDNGAVGPVIGVAFDGLGYGNDGTLWGGEWLVADLAGFTRAAHLETVAMPGGAQAIRQPWRMAAAYLDALYADGRPPTGLAVVDRHAEQWEAVRAVLRAGVNTPLTTSAGRLFDAVAAVLGVRDEIAYEGQAAIELEALAGDAGLGGTWDVGVTDGAPIVVHGTDLVRAAVDDVAAGVPADVVAGRFHATLARVVADTCCRVRERHGLDTVALSGGVFQNVLLLELSVRELEAAGFAVLRHRSVPPNDGGISLGQVGVAGAVDHR
jgi:hydrogenase maturation protein HypF